jgi:purine-nucleoside phosphorylase
MKKDFEPAILLNKNYREQSVFLPENLLREARRQKNIADCSIPAVCVLDPDGDLADYLLASGKAEKNECWSCYHSNLYSFKLGNRQVGIIPCAVGSSYAVLVAEQLFVSGCQLLLSITSAGIITEPQTAKRFALITEAIRDEGTSYHYLSKEKPSLLSKELTENLQDTDLWFRASSWTTDAPYRESPSAIAAMKAQGITCVEMEAAALYAFAEAKNKNVVCFAHLTNTMAQQEGDFEKGEYFGSIESLAVISSALNALNSND